MHGHGHKEWIKSNVDLGINRNMSCQYYIMQFISMAILVDAVYKLDMEQKYELEYLSVASARKWTKGFVKYSHRWNIQLQNWIRVSLEEHIRVASSRLILVIVVVFLLDVTPEVQELGLRGFLFRLLWPQRFQWHRRFLRRHGCCGTTRHLGRSWSRRSSGSHRHHVILLKSLYNLSVKQLLNVPRQVTHRSFYYEGQGGFPQSGVINFKELASSIKNLPVVDCQS